MNLPSLRMTAAAVLGTLACSLTACDSPTGLGAAAGAGGGAAIGAIASRGRPEGVLAGAALGAVTGTLIGNTVENDGNGPGRRNYPVATPTDRKGYVISPYAPYYEIDVRDVPHGALVRDPSCGRLFVKP